MSDLPLFYSSIVPLDSNSHRHHRLRLAAKPFGFAARAHLIPATVDEFAAAAREIPVVFAPAGKRHASVFLCGMKSGSNLFVNPDGRWNGAYVPAYLRRFPFMLGERKDADPVVCLDESYEGFSAGSEGERLFSDEGAPSAPLDMMIRLVTDFATSARRTEALCDTLGELGLLKNVTIEVQQPSGPSASIHGLSMVDEQKFNELDEATFADLRKRGLLGPIYAHLLSIGATQSLAAKMQPAADKAA
jgi:hypothetical protein